MKNLITFLITFLFLLNVNAQNNYKEIIWEVVHNTEGGTSFALNSAGDIFAGTSGHWILRSTNGGHDWESCELPNYTGMMNSTAVNSNDDIFLATASGYYDGAFYRSTDNGDNWVQLHADSGDYFTCLDINSADVIFFGTNRGVIRSFDDGNNLEPTGLNNLAVEDLIISPVLNNIFIYNGWGLVYRSTDDGNTWTDVSAGIDNAGINAFCFNTNDQIFVGAARGVFFSTNNGDNWIQTGFVNHSSFDSVVSAIFVTSANDIFIGTLGLGILYSTDNGNSWTEINSGFPAGPIIYSFIVNADGKILAGTSMGIYRSKEPIISVDDHSSNLPVSFLLSQNYPNPFNPGTKIKYSVPQVSFVQIKIFDVLGVEIETLVNEEKLVGTYEIAWNAEGVPSGVYFYQLKAKDFVETKKMVLLR